MSGGVTRPRSTSIALLIVTAVLTGGLLHGYLVVASVLGPGERLVVLGLAASVFAIYVYTVVALDRAFRGVQVVKRAILNMDNFRE